MALIISRCFFLFTFSFIATQKYRKYANMVHPMRNYVPIFKDTFKNGNVYKM